MTRRLVLGTDHGGFSLKVELIPWLQDKGCDIEDKGAHIFDPADDYPDFAEEVAKAVSASEGVRGIVICGSGVGACVTANKVPGVRAGICHDTYSARQGVEHDDMNVLCLGARIVGIELAKELVSAFLDANYSGQERHQRRLNKLLSIEEKMLQGAPSRRS